MEANEYMLDAVKEKETSDESVQDTVTDTFYIFMAAGTINTSIC